MKLDSSRGTASRGTVSRKDFIALTGKGVAGLTLLGGLPATAKTGATAPETLLVGHVVPHTHWDRAWYYPFEQFRLRLVKLMRKLLDILERDPSYKFHLDSQTIVIEDFLAVCPEQRERLIKFVRNGQLAIGPFYVQPDQFLVSGESLIRNLNIGLRQSAELGGAEMVGYQADNFGHPAQLPQILQGFHIGSFMTNMSRGIGREGIKKGRVQRWFAPDGVSSVCAYFMVGYANFYYWGFDNLNPADYPTPAPDMDNWSVGLARKQLEAAVAEYRKDAELDTAQLWLGNGVDHQEAQPHVPRLIRELNREQSQVRLVHSSCRELIEAVLAERRTLPELRGPLVEDSLFGVMTSRVYLQQSYARIAARTEMLAEPLLALADLYCKGHRAFREPQHFGFTFNPGQNWPEYPVYPQAELEHLWKLLLQNAPHDDICGCSVDPVHRDMENRFERCGEIVDSLWNDALLLLARRLQENEPDSTLPGLIAFNPHPFACGDTLRVKLALEGFSDPSELAILDSRGGELPLAVLESRAAEYPLFDGNEFNEKMMFKGLDVEAAFRPELAPCALTRFAVVKRKTSAAQAAPQATAREQDGTVAVENAFYRLTFKPDGSFDLYDKELRQGLNGLGRLEDVEDAGDEYTFTRFDPPAPAVTAEGSAGRVHILEHNSLFTSVEVSLGLTLPASLTEDRKARSKETVTSPLRLVYEIPHHRKGGALRLELDNRARDHHLFLWFPSGVSAGRFQYDCKFDWAEYPVGYAKARLDSSVVAARKEQAFGLVTDSPTIVETRQGKDGVEFGWSVVRAVDHVNAGISLRYWNASEGQCLRRISRTLEWTSGAPQTVRAACLERRRVILTAPPALSVTPSAKRRYVDSRYSTLPLVAGEPQIAIEGQDIHLSCWKKADSGQGWVVRLYSLADNPSLCRLKTRLPVSAAFTADLEEKPQEKLAGSAENGFELALGAKQIRTVLLMPDNACIESGLATKRTAG